MTRTPDRPTRHATTADANPTIPAEFLAQYVWMLHDIDPLLGELARNNPRVTHLDYSIDQLVPRYFTINGVSGVQSTENLVTVPVLPVQDPIASQVGVFIRVVNTGGRTGTAYLYPVDATTGQTSGAVYLSRQSPRHDVGAWITLARSTVTLGEVPGRLSIGLELGRIEIEVAREHMQPSTTVDVRTRSGLLSLDGSSVVELASLPYSGGETFDLVASGPTGTYLSSGIPLGSTLAPAR